MKQLLYKSGKVTIHKVPDPVVDNKSVLVRVKNSCISIGTELSGIKSSGDNLIRRAIKNPHHVRTVLSMASNSGISKVANIVKKKLDAASPIGYSAAGEVIAVGNEIKDIKIGDKVACSGAQCANHAEIICVPRNLVAKIPPNVSYVDASSITLGAIALQGLRRANLNFGETAVVLGLGVIGQILAQLLNANGIKVIGIDLDTKKIKLAKELGIFCDVNPKNEDVINKVIHNTNGFGADSVIVTASSDSSEVISQAFNLCRKKAKVVLVGDVGLDLKREDMYEKELDLLISTSYGPGRYDPTYEEDGIDYPYHYVRWTENRNMEQYLSSLSKKEVLIDNLITSITDIDDAPKLYEGLKQQNSELLSILKYPNNDIDIKTFIDLKENFKNKKLVQNRISIGVIGAGSFAKGMHLPNLAKLKNIFYIKSIMSKSGHNAKEVARQYSAVISSTNVNDLLTDNELDSVIISTRHNLHATQVLDALKSNKHVLVEKPLAINFKELKDIEDFYLAKNDDECYPMLMVGFNRRFSPIMSEIKSIVSAKTNPMVISYRMNAGYIPLSDWAHTKEGAGRNIGEACHIYDLFTFLTDSQYKKIEVSSISPTTRSLAKNDNFTTTITFNDGSIANLIYTAIGTANYQKESMEIFVDGKVLEMNNYEELKIYSDNKSCIKKKYSSKGQFEELEAFGQAIKNNDNWPIPLWQQIQSTRISLEVENKIYDGDIHA